MFRGYPRWRDPRGRRTIGAMAANAATGVLGPAFSGELIDPGHPDYDDARSLYNGMFDKRPALIARCTDAETCRPRFSTRASET